MLENDEIELFGHLSENEKQKAKQMFIVKMVTIHDTWRLKKSRALAAVNVKGNADVAKIDPHMQKL